MYGFSTSLSLTFDTALARVLDALKDEGFGVLSEIDVAQAMKQKLGVEMPPYRILGACNPPLAFAAVTADPAIGLLLPCNVTVEDAGEGRSVVRLVDPRAILAAAPSGALPALREVATDAHARMERVLRDLQRVGKGAT